MLPFRSSRKTKKQAEPTRIRIRKGDTVMIIAGKDKGKTGLVKSVLPLKNKIVVEGLNMVKKAMKPNPIFGIRGGIVEVEAPIHVSNVMVYDAKSSKPSRIGVKTIEGSDGKAKRVRVAIKSGEQLDE